MLHGGVKERAEVKPGAGEETFDERGPELHPFQPGLDLSGELGEVAFGQVGQGPRGIGDLAARWVGDQITLSDLRRSAPGARDPPICAPTPVPG